MEEAPATLPASTLVLLRPERSGFSVLLMKRPSKSSFMAGVHVFPGGRVDPEDFLCTGDCDPALPLRLGVDARHTLAYVSAALRETFEEVGVLLAASSAGPDPADARKARTALAHGELNWSTWPHAMLRAGVRLAYFDHWITPRIEPKRFDTRFFVALLPPDASPEPNAEVAEWGYWTPSDALAAVTEGRMSLAPPTLVTIERLRRFTNAEQALADLGARQVAPLEPLLVSTDPVTLALPGHPLHADPIGLAGNPQALILREGRWEIIWH